jgi:LPS export ABC transporter protein LptC
MEQVSAKFYDIHGQLLYTLHAEHSTLSKKVWQLTNLSLQHFQNQKIDYETHSKHGMYLEKNRQLELRDQVQIHIQPSPSQAETTIHTEIANIDFKKHSISSQKPSYFKNNTNDLEASGFHYLWQPEAKMLLFNIKSTLATRQSQHIAQEQD